MAPYRIMVVDDDPDVRYVVTSLLGLEFETVEALNGLDALEKIDRYEPDLLLLDISMPIMNGIACARSIQSSFAFEDLPIFFISAVSNKETRRQAESVGGLEFFEKPFDSSQLIDRINGYFAQSGAEPRPKAFSIEEVSRIDSQPLRSASGEQERDLPQTEPSATATMEPPKIDHRKRRVFGKKNKPAPTAPPEEKKQPDETAGLPPPPKPDYERINVEARRRRPAEPSQPTPEQRTEPPKEEFPKSPPRKKPDTPPAKPADGAAPAAKKAPPSPADILAERRLAALGKKREASSLKPRVLVVIDDKREFESYHHGLKGLAEFLPLEDPVEAVELIARYQPDIVALGVQTPDYSGLQLGKMLRSNQRLAHIELLYIQRARTDEKQLAAARQLSHNPVIASPVEEDRLRRAVETITQKPGFFVREKKLSYGNYVKEVIRKADAERAKENKALEKESLRDKHRSLARFMAEEFQNYKEPEGYEELKGIGRHSYEVRDWKT